jgi:hypothetical protein
MQRITGPTSDESTFLMARRISFRRTSRAQSTEAALASSSIDLHGPRLTLAHMCSGLEFGRSRGDGFIPPLPRPVYLGAEVFAEVVPCCLVAHEQQPIGEHPNRRAFCAEGVVG